LKRQIRAFSPAGRLWKSSRGEMLLRRKGLKGSSEDMIPKERKNNEKRRRRCDLASLMSHFSGRARQKKSKKNGDRDLQLLEKTKSSKEKR